jgi:hypothetical protein
MAALCSIVFPRGRKRSFAARFSLDRYRSEVLDAWEACLVKPSRHIPAHAQAVFDALHFAEPRF